MKIAIYGYGNLGRGVELSVGQNPDVQLVGIFTRRPTESVKALTDVGVYPAEKIIENAKTSDQLVYQLFDEYQRFELKMQSDWYLQARLAGAKDLKEVEDWMKDIHSQ